MAYNLLKGKRGIITGAFEGIKKTFEQASSDIFEKRESAI